MIRGWSAAIAGAAAAVISVASPGPVGVWSGHAHFKVSPKTNPRRKAIFARYAETLNKQLVTYTFRKDHTYVSTATAPRGVQQDKGKWSMSANTVKVIDAIGPKTFTMSPGGGQLHLTLPGFHGLIGDLTLTRSHRP